MAGFILEGGGCMAKNLRRETGIERLRKANVYHRHRAAHGEHFSNEMLLLNSETPLCFSRRVVFL